MAGLFLNSDRSPFHQDLIMVFQEDYEVAVVCVEEFSYELRERQLILSRDCGLSHDLHGITTAWIHGIHVLRRSVTNNTYVW